MTKTLYYLFDPLCGWCYGASAAVSELSKSPEVRLNLLPSGLFSEDGARPMDDAFAAYAWSNDQRIERLTGQRFSERYRDQVLADRHQRFDSGPATIALAAVAQTTPQKELEALKAIQHARFVDGADITRADTLVALLRGLDLDQAAAMLTGPQATLREAARTRWEQARSALQAVGARGVPAFILADGERRALLSPDSLYSNPRGFLDQVAAA